MNSTVKSTGIVRKVDELGRIVIPKELRKNLEIDEKDPLEIYVDGDIIILKKYEPFCTFCGGSHNVFTFSGKNICQDCAKKLQSFVQE